MRWTHWVLYISGATMVIWAAALALDLRSMLCRCYSALVENCWRWWLPLLPRMREVAAANAVMQLCRTTAHKAVPVSAPLLLFSSQ